MDFKLFGKAILLAIIKFALLWARDKFNTKVRPFYTAWATRATTDGATGAGGWARRASTADPGPTTLAVLTQIHVGNGLLVVSHQKPSKELLPWRKSGERPVK